MILDPTPFPRALVAAAALATAVLAGCGGGGDLPATGDARSDAPAAALDADTGRSFALAERRSGAPLVRLPVASQGVTASAHDGNRPANVVDGRLDTRWAAQGVGQWVQLDLGAVSRVGSVRLAFHVGDSRRSYFDIQLSVDGRTWTTPIAGQTSWGTTLGLESHEIADTPARFVRIVGRGNERTDWNAITEVEVWGSTAGSAVQVPLQPGAATASAHDGNPPAHTLDGRGDTRWSAHGPGAWIQYDLGALRQVSHLRLAWHRGHERVQAFDVQASTDGRRFTSLVSGARSAGTTGGFETVDVPDAPARFLRIVGHGNTVNDWNSLAEAQVYALPAVPLQVSVRGAGRVEPVPARADRPPVIGDTVRLMATPQPGHRFVGWSGDADGNANPLSLTLDRARSVVATFEPLAIDEVTLDVEVGGAGEVTRSPQRPTYPVGATVRLLATPEPGHRFEGWSGAVAGMANPIDVPMTEARRVRASFAAVGCRPVPAQVRAVFEVEGDAPYQADGCTLVFDALRSRHLTDKGNGWRNELKVRQDLRAGMSRHREAFAADVRIDHAPGAKTIVAQYHAQGTGTLMKVFVADTDEHGTARDGVFDVYVRTLPRGASREEVTLLGEVRPGESFRLSVLNDRGEVSVSALGRRQAPIRVDEGGESFLKFGDYLQAKHPTTNKTCLPQARFGECYREWGVTRSRATFSNIEYERRP